MTRPRPPIQATAVLLATWCLVFLRSSSAPAVPALRPPPPASAPGGTLCFTRERDALLAFKAGLTDPSNYLSSWRGEVDCCRWAGVECSNQTGHVVKLQVNSEGELVPGTTIGGEISSSLLTLRHLKHLDLSYNNFGGRPIPEFIGGLGNLTHLLLANSYFGGRIPPHLGNLSNLLVLEIYYFGDDYHQPHSCYSPSLAWVSRLRKLRQLAMSGVDLSAAVDWAHAVNMLPSLVRLDLSSCGLRNTMPLPFRSNLTALETLDLNHNSFNSSFGANYLAWDLPMLSDLSMDGCGIQGPIPAAVGNLSLSRLWLSNNKLSGEIPVGIRKLTNLVDLWLDSNNLHGTLTQDHFTNLTSLQNLWLSGNSITMLVNNTWNTPFSLISAGFRSCILGPQFPGWINQQTLHTLDISNTSIHDSIPASFWMGMYRCRVLDLSENQIVGMLPTFFLFGGMEAVILDISSNQLVGPIPTLPTNLALLDLSGNNLSGALPSDIGAPGLEILMLFKNSFSGTIPCSVFELQNLLFLDLSENQLNGTLANCLRAPKTSNMTMLNLNSNNLLGGIPSFLQRCKELKFLDLAYNQFSGSLPTWIGSKLPYLAFMRLRSNMLSGGIPDELTKMNGLQYLDIASNNISGNIPLSVGNLIAMARTPDQEGALFKIVNFGFASIFKYTNAYTDSLSVVTKGQQLEYTTGIAYMVSIDFSCNSLTGKIPHEIGMLTALTNLNLSWNHLSSTIPLTIRELRAVESFDLSHNELSGQIPASMADLTSLAHLNLSYNNLTGTIPSGNQLQTLDDASIYAGNPGLCGPPVSRNCSGPEITPWTPENQHEGMSDALSLYLGIGTGFVVGLWIIFCCFLFKRRWRAIWFSFFDRVCDWVYVRVAVRWASFTRKE